MLDRGSDAAPDTPQGGQHRSRTDRLEMQVSTTDWVKKYDALSERDKKIWDLARNATNALGFALQDANSERLVLKYENEAEETMHALFELLTGNQASDKPTELELDSILKRKPNGGLE